MSFNPLKSFRRRRIVRAGVGLLVLAGAAFAQYRLTNVPLPVNIEKSEKFSPATIKLGQEELVIEGPVVNSAEGMLFSHDGMPNETVDVILERARLDDKTISMFEVFGLKPPSTPARIDYQPQESKSSAGKEPCRTRVELFAASKMPAEIHLFQLGDPGGNYYRHLEMSTSGAELVSTLLTMSLDYSDLAPGCQYLLTVGDWKMPITKNPVTAIVAENSDLRFYFRALTPDSTPWADTEGLLPLDLGSKQLKPTDPLPLQARAVSIRSLGVGDSTSATLTRASARSTDGGPLLTISGLKIGSDQLQLNIAGKGWVKINGEDVTVSFLERVNENPLLSTILAAINTALLAWVARLILKSPSTRPQPVDSQGRSRKSQRRRKRGAKKQTRDG